MTDTISKRPPVVLDCLYYAVSISLFLAIFVYYWTGMGGPTLLAMTLIPVVFVMFTLQALRENDLYPALPPAANYADRIRLLRIFVLLRLLHEHGIHGARP